jgi:extradiol dioxygenase family protein
MLQPFHLAIPVHDLNQARDFYGELLGCSEGRASDHWVDWNFWGHQVVTHLDKTYTPRDAINLVDGKDVGVPHFGIVLEWHDWETLKTRIEVSDIEFVLEPYIRFKGEKGEQGTFFIRDFSGNRLEFKTFRHLEQLFVK